MFNLTYLINITIEVPFSYFIKRVAIRFFFKFPKFILLALLFTFIIAVIYFLISPKETPKPKVSITPKPKAINPVYKPRIKPIVKTQAAPTLPTLPTLITSKDLYKKRIEEKRKKREEILSKVIKK